MTNAPEGEADASWLDNCQPGRHICFCACPWGGGDGCPSPPAGFGQGEADSFPGNPLSFILDNEVGTDWTGRTLYQAHLVATFNMAGQQREMGIGVPDTQAPRGSLH